MIDAAPAEREKVATQIYRECVTRAYPEAEVTFNHSRCVELLAVCALQQAEAAYWLWKDSHEDFGANQQKVIDGLRKSS